MKLEEYLDAGHGACWLRNKQAAEIVAGRLHHFDGQRYDLHSFVIMPNHVHVLFAPYETGSLPKIVQGWKGISSRLIKQAGLAKANHFGRTILID